MTKQCVEQGAGLGKEVLYIILLVNTFMYVQTTTRFFMILNTKITSLLQRLLKTSANKSTFFNIDSIS